MEFWKIESFSDEDEECVIIRWLQEHIDSQRSTPRREKKGHDKQLVADFTCLLGALCCTDNWSLVPKSFKSLKRKRSHKCGGRMEECQGLKEIRLTSCGQLHRVVGRFDLARESFVMLAGATKATSGEKTDPCFYADICDLAQHRVKLIDADREKHCHAFSIEGRF